MEKYLEIKNAIQERVDCGLMHSATIGVSVKGQELFRYKIGTIDRQIFRLASMTKPITAAAILICQDMGLVSVKDEVEKYIPSFQNMKVGKVVDGKVVFDKDCPVPMTIEHILTHSSGLGSGDVGNLQWEGVKVNELEEQVEKYSKWYLDFVPGSSQLYSGTVALDVVARIVEVVSGMKYIDFLKKYLFEPLDMIDTTYKLTEEQKVRLVPMYQINEERTNSFHKELEDRYAGFDGIAEGYTSGCAGMFSTYDDYSHFASMLANGGEYNGKRILSKQAVLDMAVPRLSTDFVGIDQFFNWGYGVYVRGNENKDFQKILKGSFGWSGAYSTHFFIDPSLNLSAVMMTNMNNDLGSGSPSIQVFEKVVREHIIDKL